MAELILTNGDAAADLLAAAGFEATILAWRDVLHEGPVVPAPSLEALSEIRAAALAERFGLDFALIRSEFGARDAVLHSHARFDRIAIWVEHDLFDQLQLVQMLDFFAGEGRSEGVFLVQADDFLGHQTPVSIRRFAVRERPVNAALLAAGRAAMAAVSAPTPEAVLAASLVASAELPFLAPAFRRFLEELPDPVAGLSRTEEAMLDLIGEDRPAPVDLFRAALAREEAAFMGDWTFFRILEDLAAACRPLVDGLAGAYAPLGDEAANRPYLTGPLELTAFGRSVLAGETDHAAINGIERWWGGTRLSGGACWRYDRNKGTLMPPP
ncbi:MAG: hypothetical protein U1E56_04325 [Bauldia sp.]